jgi:hypothetical protein
VEGLPPGAPYTTWWPLQQRRLSGAGSLPPHLLRGWLADLWGTALQQELGLGPGALRGLGAVLLVPENMPAQEVNVRLGDSLPVADNHLHCVDRRFVIVLWAA